MPKYKVTYAQQITHLYEKTFEAEDAFNARHLADQDLEDGPVNGWTEVEGDLTNAFIANVRREE